MKIIITILHTVSIILALCGLYILSLDANEIPKYTRVGYIVFLVLAIAAIVLVNRYLSLKLKNKISKNSYQLLGIALLPGLFFFIFLFDFINEMSFSVNDVLLTIHSKNIKEIETELGAMFPEENREIISSEANTTVIKLIVSDAMKRPEDRLTDYDVERFSLLKKAKIYKKLEFTMKLSSTGDPALFDIFNVKPGQDIPFTLSRSNTKVMIVNQNDISIPRYIRRFRCSIAMKINDTLPKLTLDAIQDSDKDLIVKYKESSKRNLYGIYEYTINYDLVPDKEIEGIFGSVYIVDGYLIMPFELHEINTSSCGLAVRDRPYKLRLLNVEEFRTFPVTLLANFYFPKLASSELSVELIESVKERNYNEFVRVVNNKIMTKLGRRY